MASGAQLIDVPIAPRIDEANRVELVDPASGFPVLTNGRIDKANGYSKRHGFTFLSRSRVDSNSAAVPLTTTSTRSAGRKLFSHGATACVIDGDVIDAYSTAGAYSHTRGRVSPCSLAVSPAPAPPGQSGYVVTDSCRSAGMLAIAYMSGVDCYVSVSDATSGAVVRPTESIGSMSVAESYTKLAAYGVYIFVFLFDSTSANIKYRYLDTTSAATIATGWTVAANVATDHLTTNNLAFGVESLTDRVAVAYVNDSGGASRLTVKTLQIAGVAETATVNTSSVTPAACALEGSIADTLWVAWNETTDVKLKGLDADSLASALATTGTVIQPTNAPPFDGIGIVSSATAGAGRLFVNDTTAVQLLMRNFTTSGGAVNNSGSTTGGYNVVRTCRPFRIGTRYYATCRGYDTSDKIVALCDLSDSLGWVRPVANVAPGLASNGISCVRASAHSATEYWLPFGQQTTGNVVSVMTAKFDFASSKSWTAVRHAGLTYLSGGMLSVFDGARVTEAGFIIKPPAPTLSNAGSGITGNFSYVAVYEQVDGAGNWNVSGVSSPVLSGAITDDTITVTVRSLGISGRISQSVDPTVRISIYRTATGSVPPYYYLASVSNDRTAATQTYADATADATLITRAKLYAPSLPGVNGSAQDHRAPPGLPFITAYNGMLVGALGEDIYFSSQNVFGEGPWFNPVFQTSASGDGEITGLASLDGTLFVFKRRSVWAVSGDAPFDNGTGGLGTPRKLAAHVGCVDSRSIVVTELGIFFQSERGIEILDRGGSVMWIGEPIRDTLDAFPIVASAALDPTEPCVYFELATTESAGFVTGTGRACVYDLAAKAWVSTDRRAKYDGTADTPAQSSCMIYDGTVWRYAWLQTDGYVRVETSDYLDVGSASTWVTMTLETGWFKLGGLSGQQAVNRVTLLAKKSTRADQSIALAYDYSDSYQTATTWVANTVDTVSSALGRVRLQHQAHDDANVGVSFRVKLADATPTGGTITTGQGMTWIGLTVEGVQRPGSYPLPESSV